MIDGGNSNWRDSVRRAEALGALGIGFIDAGTSGGVWGRTEGYCLMVGGAPEHVAFAQPAFDALGARGRLRPHRCGRAPATSRRWCTTASSTA